MRLRSFVVAALAPALAACPAQPPHVEPLIPAASVPLEPRDPRANPAAFARAVADGFDAAHAHRYPDAIRAFERALAESPGDDALLLLVAVMHDRAGSTDAEIAALRALVARGSDRVPVGRELRSGAARPEVREAVERLRANAARGRRSTVAFENAEVRGLLPEGIAWDPDARVFYVGSIRRRTILRVEPGGAAAPLLAAPLPYAVLGLRVDAARRVLWAACEADADQEGYAESMKGRSALVKIDLRERAVAAAFEPPPGAHLFNDVALDAAGAPFVTDSEAGQAWTLTPGGALAPVLPPKSLEYPNGIAFDDAGHLFVADAYGIARVDGGSATRLPFPRGASPLGIDGLYFDRGRLVAVENAVGAPRVVAYRLDADRTAIDEARVLESAHPAFGTATTGAIAGDAIFVIADAQLGGAQDEPRPLAVVRVPLQI